MAHNLWHLFKIIRSNGPEIEIWQVSDLDSKEHLKTSFGRQIIAPL